MTGIHYSKVINKDRRTFLKGASGLAGAAFLSSLGWSVTRAEAAEGVLRVVPQADLRTLDPVFTTAQITANHAHMIYDMLFAMNDELEPQPQMIGDYSISDDGLTYQFTLREGLKFHDGTDVTASDCVASIKRWSQTRTEGGLMMDRADSLEADDEKSFTLQLSEPFGMVLLALANPVLPCVIMREEDAQKAASEQVETTVGSGPFIFVDDEWDPGHKVVYRRNPDYVPREEPANGLAGGKVVNVERVEWLYIPDPGTAVQALQAGEVDMLEFPSHDMLPQLDGDPNIAVKVIDPVGYQGMLRMNTLIHPFDHPKARQALLHLVQTQQQDYLSAMIGVPDYERVCLSPFICGSPSESEAGLEQFEGGEDPFEVARKLFEEAGYDGRPVVFMDPTDQNLMHLMSLVAADHLRRAGVEVELQAQDWSTLTSRRPIKEGPEEDRGGWHIFPTWWPGFTMQNPITNVPLDTSCDGDNWYGWPCDEELEELRVTYANAQGVEERQTIMDELQTRFFESVPYVHVGQFFRPVAFVENRISGVVGQQSPAFWNIEKS
ncbi:ABC transporter substrate-binding protein [Fodinicurvata sediminis]|uniref:ABC transporter substrate-binding protein n=1 Tax=Fodinicurvata sediminis TaxID=1121832 RepID=UPI0003B4B420|nr:ABC transporter substrate-binding protein [Fodinicurvata sediminis]